MGRVRCESTLYHGVLFLLVPDILRFAVLDSNDSDESCDIQDTRSTVEDMVCCFMSACVLGTTGYTEV